MQTHNHTSACKLTRGCNTCSLWRWMLLRELGLFSSTWSWGQTTTRCCLAQFLSHQEPCFFLVLFFSFSFPFLNKAMPGPLLVPVFWHSHHWIICFWCTQHHSFGSAENKNIWNRTRRLDTTRHIYIHKNKYIYIYILQPFSLDS